MNLIIDTHITYIVNVSEDTEEQVRTPTSTPGSILRCDVHSEVTFILWYL